MAIYEIKVVNHWQSVVTSCVKGGEKDAVDSMKNEMSRMGYKGVEGVEAVEIRRMNESYGSGGYSLIPVESFHAVQ